MKPHVSALSIYFSKQFICVTFTAVVIAGGCALPPEQCDPSDSSFGKSFRCRSAYETRKTEQKIDLQNLVDQTSEDKYRLKKLKAEHERVVKQLNDTKTKHQSIMSRIESLKSQNSATESQIQSLQTRWKSIDDEIQTLIEQQNAITENESGDEIANRLNTLLDEQAELEELLLDLEG